MGGSGTWHLIYEADDKMRSEGIDAIRRRTKMAIARGEATPHHWCEENPWIHCFRMAAHDDKYWDNHVTREAVAWLAKGGRGRPQTVEETLRNYYMPGEVAAEPPTIQTGPRQQKGPQSQAPTPGSKSQMKKAEKRARAESAGT